jgi:hypothetical protein
MKKNFAKLSILTFFIYLLVQSCFGFQRIAWGTGIWWGEYSIKWAMFFIVYVVLCAFSVLVAVLLLWRQEKFQHLFNSLAALRERLGGGRWLVALTLLLLPVWFFQYTSWGLVFKDVYIRLLIWLLIALTLAFVLKQGSEFLGWKEFVASILLTSSLFVIAVPFINVTNYPFSLGWSEGNRMWDYSILFGRRLYDYPADKDIVVLLDIGRKFIGGFPFIFPGITIGMERFWIALTVIIPYLLFGFVGFRFARSEKKIWLLATLWVLIFLKQGPIHPPLIFCAVAVALIWQKPLVLAIPLIALTGYVAEESRFTWLFAPGLWIGTLELAGAILQNKKLHHSSWIRAISLSVAGAVGGYFIPKITDLFANGAGVSTAVSVTGIVSQVSDQPLLWYRLFPNATYGMGILTGLLIATLPLMIILLYLVIEKKWTLNIWQALAVTLPLLAFLTVGLIVSTKIGGGGDLHNMDMFLISLVFIAALIWKQNGSEHFVTVDLLPFWVKIVLILSMGLPGLQSLQVMRSYDFGKDASWLVTLTDAKSEKSLDMYPSQDVTDAALKTIKEEVSLARSMGGEVLFMDQRQLLTFGFITDVPLVAEYEKKFLMDEALSSNSVYFEKFYSDISTQRFSLIISEPLRAPIKDSSYQFGEENNAWVKWVSNPVLCYYEPKITLKEVGVQLLVPINQPADCSGQLP